MTRRRHTGPKGRAALDEIESRLGDLFGRIGDVIDAAERSGSDGPRGDGQDARGPVRVSGGLRVRVGGETVHDTGSDAAPDPSAQMSEPPGDADPTRPPRVPDLEMHEDGSRVLVLGELPGADPDTLDLRVEEGCLHLRASGAVDYAGALDLPGDVDADRMRSRLVNGILEVVLPRSTAEDHS